MDFITIKKAIEKHVSKMMEDNSILYVANVEEDVLYNLYLDTIPAQHNKIYRIRREYDCSCCRHYIKRLGAVVAINGTEVESIWDVETEDENWNMVCTALSEYVKSCGIKSVFLTSPKETTFGCDHNISMLDRIRYEHFCTNVSNRFVNHSVGTAMSEYQSTHDVCKRGLDELTTDAVLTVLELINQDSLYRGTEHKKEVNDFYNLKKKYETIPDVSKDVFVWGLLSTSHVGVLRIRNTSIGTLMIDISNGVELDEAVRKYEAMVAPSNYKRSKPVFTQRMLDDARAKLTELGYIDSLKRRYATADDISVDNILFVNRDTAKQVDADLFAELSKETKSSPKKFSKVEEISAEDFVANVLPTAKEVYAYVENRHSKNFVSLIAPEIANSKSMFKWDNNFSWAYTGNATDSELKKNVEKAGGSIDGVMRFSIQWNDTGEYNGNDEDAHCILPNKEEIAYYNKHNYTTGGELDVDIMSPVRNEPAVENITFSSRDKLLVGEYLFFVNTYCSRGGRGGFRAEIEVDGELYQYDYSTDTRDNKNVNVAIVKYNKDGTFTVNSLLDSTYSTKSKKLWNVTTNDFVPVSVVCYSPNYWDKQTGNGNLHYFFMLKNCINEENPNGFYNEFLCADLYPAHRKVMEAVGSKCHVSETENQLSGLGFSSTQRNDLIVKVVGASERVLRVKF